MGVRNLADPIRVDSSNPEDPMSQLAVVMLVLFGQMEHTYSSGPHTEDTDPGETIPLTIASTAVPERSMRWSPRSFFPQTKVPRDQRCDPVNALKQVDYRTVFQRAPRDRLEGL